jgi:hypothetical protein
MKFIVRIIHKIARTPALGLLFLAPIFGELISVHQRPIDFLNPLTFVLLCLPYGLGAILCREYWVRWTNKGIVALILTGIAYGLFEEAVVVRSIFNPNWFELGNIPKDTYWGGIQWTYGYMLLHFHASISIPTSIITAEVLYPDNIHEQWISKKAFAGVFGVFVLWIPAGFLFTQYFPNILLYIGGWLAIGLCLITAKILSAKLAINPLRKIPPPLMFYVIGAINTTVIFVGIFSLPEYIHIPFPVLVGGLLIVDILSIYVIVRFTNNGEQWTDIHKLAFISGLITFFLLFGIFKDFKEKFSGSSIVSLLAIILVMNLFRRIKDRGRKQYKTSMEDGEH